MGMDLTLLHLSRALTNQKGFEDPTEAMIHVAMVGLLRRVSH